MGSRIWLFAFLHHSTRLMLCVKFDLFFEHEKIREGLNSTTKTERSVARELE